MSSKLDLLTLHATCLMSLVTFVTGVVLLRNQWLPASALLVAAIVLSRISEKLLVQHIVRRNR